MSVNESYSSLFTAGLFGFNDCGYAGGVLPEMASVQNPTSPTSLLPPPPSPTRKTGMNAAPRRRRRSSVTISSSPMAAVKSPVQRVHYAQRAVQRTSGALIASEGKEFNTRPNSIWSLPEYQTLSRSRKSAIPALRNPPPDVPLPDIPSKSRKDTNMLPLKSPALFHFSHDHDPVSPLQPVPSLLAPSPIINDKAKNLTLSVPSPMYVDRGQSSPILGSFPGIDGEGYGQNGMILE
ncbi:hypothetical protein FRC02_004648 [Tulasnella sp. 418]|nr:hypothetical protein FRC02_004648 [Tulasnella sp. 418]